MKDLNKSYTFYTSAVCDVCDILQVWGKEQIKNTLVKDEEQIKDTFVKGDEQIKDTLMR